MAVVCVPAGWLAVFSGAVAIEVLAVGERDDGGGGDALCWEAGADGAVAAGVEVVSGVLVEASDEEWRFGDV